jgi:hypothetical protein
MNQADHSRRWVRIALLTTLVFAHLPDSAPLSQTAQTADRGGLDLICPLVEHERRRDLEDYELELKPVAGCLVGSRSSGLCARSRERSIWIIGGSVTARGFVWVA